MKNKKKNKTKNTVSIQKSPARSSKLDISWNLSKCSAELDYENIPLQQKLSRESTPASNEVNTILSENGSIQTITKSGDIANRLPITQTEIDQDADLLDDVINGKRSLTGEDLLPAAFIHSITDLELMRYNFERDPKTGKSRYDVNGRLLADGSTPLHQVIRSKDQKALKFFLDTGADCTLIDYFGDNAILTAIKVGCANVINKIWPYKGSLNIDHANVHGMTALHLATEQKWEGCVNFLLQNKANPNLKSSNGLTPLMIAASKGCMALVERLVKAGADILAVDKEHNTSVHKAFTEKHEDIVTFLLSHLPEPSRETFIKDAVESVLQPVTPEYEAKFLVTRFLSLLIACTKVKEFYHAFYNQHVVHKITLTLENHMKNIETAFHASHLIFCIMFRFGDTLETKFVRQFMYCRGPELLIHLIKFYTEVWKIPEKNTILSFLPMIGLVELAEGRAWLTHNYIAVSEYTNFFDANSLKVYISPFSGYHWCLETKYFHTINGIWRHFLDYINKVQLEQREKNIAELLEQEERDKERKLKKKNKHKRIDKTPEKCDLNNQLNAIDNTTGVEAANFTAVANTVSCLNYNANTNNTDKDTDAQYSSINATFGPAAKVNNTKLTADQSVQIEDWTTVQTKKQTGKDRERNKHEQTNSDHKIFNNEEASKKYSSKKYMKTQALKAASMCNPSVTVPVVNKTRWADVAKSVPNAKQEQCRVNIPSHEEKYIEQLKFAETDFPNLDSSPKKEKINPVTKIWFNFHSPVVDTTMRYNTETVNECTALNSPITEGRALQDSVSSYTASRNTTSTNPVSFANNQFVKPVTSEACQAGNSGHTYAHQTWNQRAATSHVRIDMTGSDYKSQANALTLENIDQLDGNTFIDVMPMQTNDYVVKAYEETDLASEPQNLTPNLDKQRENNEHDAAETKANNMTLKPEIIERVPRERKTKGFNYKKFQQQQMQLQQLEVIEHQEMITSFNNSELTKCETKQNDEQNVKMLNATTDIKHECKTKNSVLLNKKPITPLRRHDQDKHNIDLKPNIVGNQDDELEEEQKPRKSGLQTNDNAGAVSQAHFLFCHQDQIPASQRFDHLPPYRHHADIPHLQHLSHGNAIDDTFESREEMPLWYDDLKTRTGEQILSELTCAPGNPEPDRQTQAPPIKDKMESQTNSRAYENLAADTAIIGYIKSIPEETLKLFHSGNNIKSSITETNKVLSSETNDKSRTCGTFENIFVPLNTEGLEKQMAVVKPIQAEYAQSIPAGNCAFGQQLLENACRLEQECYSVREEVCYPDGLGLEPHDASAVEAPIHHGTEQNIYFPSFHEDTKLSSDYNENDISVFHKMSLIQLQHLNNYYKEYQRQIMDDASMYQSRFVCYAQGAGMTGDVVDKYLQGQADAQEHEHPFKNCCQRNRTNQPRFDINYCPLPFKPQPSPFQNSEAAVNSRMNTTLQGFRAPFQNSEAAVNSQMNTTLQGFRAPFQNSEAAVNSRMNTTLQGFRAPFQHSEAAVNSRMNTTLQGFRAPFQIQKQCTSLPLYGVQINQSPSNMIYNAAAISDNLVRPLYPLLMYPTNIHLINATQDAMVSQVRNKILDICRSMIDAKKKSVRWSGDLSNLRDLLPDKLMMVENIMIPKRDEDRVIVARHSAGNAILGYLSDGSEVAVKIIDGWSKKLTVDDLEHLINIDGSKLFINKYKVYSIQGDLCYLAMDLHEYQLTEYLKLLSKGRRVDAEIAIPKLIFQFMRGISNLHQHYLMVHGELWPDNIIIDIDGNVCVAGYGLNRNKEGGTNIELYSDDDKCWLAPEVLMHKQKSSFKSDIWVAGMLIYYILKGKNPFGSETNEIIGNIREQNYQMEYINEEVGHLLSMMLSINRTERPCISDCLRHPLFWSDEKRLRFVIISGSDVLREYRSNVPTDGSKKDSMINIIGSMPCHFNIINWMPQIEDPVMRDMKAFRQYKNTVVELVLFVFNCCNHYVSLSEKSLQIINEPCKYFLTKFPTLFMTVYRAIKMSNRRQKSCYKPFF